MVLGDVGLGQVVWTTLFIVMLVLFICLFVFVVRDLLRDHALSGWAKAGWVVAIILFPVLGSLVYLLARGGGTRGEALAEGSAARAHLTRTEFDRRARRDADSTGSGPVED